MLTVQIPPEQVKSELKDNGLPSEISGFPHPTSTVLSGDAHDLDIVHDTLEHHDIDAQRRNIEYDMHSSHVACVAEQIRTNADIFPPYEAQNAEVRPDIRHWSNVTGAELPKDTPLDANYWAEHPTTPIHFCQCVGGIYESAIRNQQDVIFLDLGMGPRLTRLVQNTLQDTQQWKSGQVQAVSLITSTSFDEDLKSREGWALDSLRDSIKAVIKKAPKSWDTLFKQKVDESEVDMGTERERGLCAAPVNSGFSGLNAPTLVA